MRNLKTLVKLPRYTKDYPLQARLPDKIRDWTHGGRQSIVTDKSSLLPLQQQLQRFNKAHAWQWPQTPHLFFSDLHADADAFVESLIASGGLQKTGTALLDFELTAFGKNAIFVIGGDCFDKGPSSLTLLRVIRGLIHTGAKVRILAGNHDVRVRLGMLAVGSEKVEDEHFFIRTGPKILPLLKEIYQHYVSAKMLRKGPNEKQAKALLYPRDSWFEAFAQNAKAFLSDHQIAIELERVMKKCQRFEKSCDKHGMTLAQVYAATQVWQQLFLKPQGEFYWFYNRMQLVKQSGSLLFVHAGMDNRMARLLLKNGSGSLNKQFRHAMQQRPAEFYYGPLCNMVRTKYRKQDHNLSAHGTRYLQRAGITAIIHGHRNLLHGQRLALRKGLISFECDVTLDCASRRKESLKGHGAGVTIIHPQGYILGISADYPFAKFFHPRLTAKRLAGLVDTQK